MEASRGKVRLINILGVGIPVAVGILLGIRQKIPLGEWTSFLPLLHAIINGTTAVALLMALFSIKAGKVQLHKGFMLLSVVLGAFFLISYIVYHISTPSTHFGGTGWVKYLYFFILISHIVLAAVVVRFVLFGLYYAVTDNYERHKKVVKIGFPIWLYVSVTGVLVYVMISPYYS